MPLTGTNLPGGQHPLEDEANLLRWEPWVRAMVYDFEVFSRLQFTHRTESGLEASALWHVEDVSAAANPPTVKLMRLATMIRPPDKVFIKQLDLVNNYADLREDRASEILAQLDAPLAFWSSVIHLHPDRRRWTLELIGTALRMAAYAEMRFKHSLACRRPVELSPQIQPIVLTPGHGTLPSGHCCEAFVAAYVLWKLVANPSPARCEQLMRQANRIAVNRTIAGVHFPVDSVAGQLLGLSLGEYFVARCEGGDYHHRRFKGHAFAPEDQDFDWRKLVDGSTGSPPAATPAWADVDAVQAVQQSAILNWLWKRARKEWKNS